MALNKITKEQKNKQAKNKTKLVTKNIKITNNFVKDTNGKRANGD